MDTKEIVDSFFCELEDVSEELNIPPDKKKLIEKIVRDAESAVKDSSNNQVFKEQKQRCLHNIVKIGTSLYMVVANMTLSDAINGKVIVLGMSFKYNHSSFGPDADFEYNTHKYRFLHEIVNAEILTIDEFSKELDNCHFINKTYVLDNFKEYLSRYN